MAHINHLATGETVGGRRHRVPARARRALRRGPRPRVETRMAASPGAGLPGLAEMGDLGLGAGFQPQPLAEWHDLTPGELAAEWAGLRAWVTWLSGRYELSVEERLPRCWLLHPGLVEELRALRAWREEIYSSGQAGMGQAARYWHAELRAMLHAAATSYAAGCRTGHRGAAELAGISQALRDQWGGAWPLAGVPPADIAAGQARGDGDRWASGQEVAAALDSGDAMSVPRHPGAVTWNGARWAAASVGWVQVSDGPGLEALEVHHQEVLPWMTRCPRPSTSLATHHAAGPVTPAQQAPNSHCERDRWTTS